MSVSSRRWFQKAATLSVGTLAMSLLLQPGEALSSEQEAPHETPTNSAPAQAAIAALSPEVKAFIQDTSLFHAADVPDANEPVAVLRQYLAGNELLVNGDHDGAIEIFSRAVAAHPDSRHAHAGLAYALWDRYEHDHSQADLRRAVVHFVKAAEIGMDYGRVRYTDMLARSLAEMNDRAQLDRVFRRALSVVKQPGVGNSRYAVTLDYATALARMGRPEAEQYFQEAVQLAPDGQIDALTGFAEWLLDSGKPARVLTLIDPQLDVEYAHFLRGVALERLGQVEAARSEYVRYQMFSKAFPAPARFRIPGSVAQEGVSFEDGAHSETHCTGHTRLSIMIYCEARGESEGGQRLVGWTARKRVMRGTISGCISINNSGATLCDKYSNVLTQSGQFYLGCGARSSTSDHVAYDVFYGYANDPLSGYCAGGAINTSCSGTVHCPGSTTGAGVHSPVWFDLGCGASTTCRHNHGTLCGNDNVGNDHCFYNYHE